MKKNKNKIKNIITFMIPIVLTIIFLSGVFVLGWLGNDIYRDIKNKRILDGLYMKADNWNKAYETANNLDKNSDWVCINILDMSFPRAYNTCVHECSHASYSEIFAEICEKDFEKCQEIIGK